LCSLLLRSQYFFLVKPRYVLKAEDVNFTPVDVACGPKMVGEICS